MESWPLRQGARRRDWIHPAAGAV